VGDRDYRPLSYVEEGAPRGLDVEVAREVGRQLGRPVKIELMGWALAQEKIRKGEADVFLGMSITKERKASFDFSVAAFEHEFGLFVRSGETTINNVEDVANRRVGVTRAGYPSTRTHCARG
jgi:polar amino acid transport system substrate-binding protein